MPKFLSLLLPSPFGIPYPYTEFCEDFASGNLETMQPRFATRTLAMAPGDRRPRTRQSLRSSSCENERLAHHHYHQIRLETDEETQLKYEEQGLLKRSGS
jgi:hypothetical protein